MIRSAFQKSWPFQGAGLPGVHPLNYTFSPCNSSNPHKTMPGCLLGHVLKNPMVLYLVQLSPELGKMSYFLEHMHHEYRHGYSSIFGTWSKVRLTLNKYFWCKWKEIITHGDWDGELWEQSGRDLIPVFPSVDFVLCYFSKFLHL
jgi:hypothetical protein